MYKEVILSKIKEYIKKQKIPSKSSGKMFMLQCPICKNEALTAMKVPNTYLVNCIPCGIKLNLVQYVRHHEKDKAEWSDEEILQYLKEFLQLEVTTKKDELELENELNKYEKRGWDLVPVAKGWKNPIEEGWTKKEHKNKDEWAQWILNGLNVGCKTGGCSGVTVLDIDAMPTDMKKALYEGKLSPKDEKEAYKIREENLNKVLEVLGHPENDTLYLENTGGIQLFYNYVKEIPKTTIKIEDIPIDIENEGGQVIIPPSIVKGQTRKFINENIIDMPETIKTLINKQEVKPSKTNSEEIFEKIESENFKLDLSDIQLKNNNLEGCCNNSFISLMGILRKQLQPKDTRFVLNVLNRHLLERPMAQSAIDGMCKEVEKYIHVDEKDLAHKILEYLELTESASKAEIEIAVLGKRATGEDKKRIDKILVYLIQEEKITKKGERQYRILESMDWSDSLINVAKPVTFNIPYIGDYAYFNYGDFIVLGSQNKFGKCHSKGTEILMANGSVKKVENIEKGDRVQGYNNQIRIVQETCTGYGKMFEIQPVGSESFTVNGEHILCLYHLVKKEFDYITVNKYLKKSNYYKRMTVLYSSPVAWKFQNVDLDPYFLGLWLGDGHSAGGRITTKDKEIVNYLNNYADAINMTLSKYKPNNRCPMYAIVDKNNTWQNKYDIVQRLRKYNLINNKHIPQAFKINNRLHRLELLAGLIDSDGYLTKQNNFELSFKNYILAKDVEFLARSLGFHTCFNTNKASFNTIRHRILISGQTALIPTKIKRKKSNKVNPIKHPLHYGFKIKELSNDNYYGFTLDGDKRYLLSNFIVNHNTTLAMNIVKQFVDQGIKPYYIYSESGGRFKKTALRLGMKDGDFNHIFCGNPYDIHLEKGAVTIYDWVRPIEGFNKTDDLYDSLVQKLHKTQGFMICFVQLKTNNDWFASNMITQYPALACKYLYENEDDGTNTYFHLSHVRDPKQKGKEFKIPCTFDWETKEVKQVEDYESGEEPC